MTPTEALAALVAAVEGAWSQDDSAGSRWKFLPDIAPALAQAQAVLAQPEIVRYYDPELGDTRSGVATTDRTTCPSCRHAPGDPACVYCSCCSKVDRTAGPMIVGHCDDCAHPPRDPGDHAMSHVLSDEEEEWIQEHGPDSGFWGRACARLLRQRETLTHERDEARAALREVLDILRIQALDIYEALDDTRRALGESA
jgi:hypothetical protein